MASRPGSRGASGHALPQRPAAAAPKAGERHPSGTRLLAPSPGGGSPSRSPRSASPGRAAKGQADVAGAGCDDLNSTLRSLFAAFDRNGDKVLSIEEFVETQTMLVEWRGEAFDKGKEVAAFFDMSLTGPLDFAKFSNFWLESFSEREPTGDEAAAHKDALKALAHLRGANPPAPSAGGGAAAAREIRAGGGGNASASKGFVESADDALGDLDAFEKRLKDLGDSSDDETKKKSFVDKDIAILAKELRAIRKKRKSAKGRDADALRASEKSLGDQLRQLFQKRAKEQRGKLVIKGTVNCKGDRIEGARVTLSRNSKSIGSTLSNKSGAFSQDMKAQHGIATSLAVSKDGFAEAVKRVGGDGVRHVRFELLPLTVKEKFKATPGSKETKVFSDAETGAQFEVPVGQICKDNQPFEGEAEFSAAVVDVSKPGGLETMPALTGRSVAGAVTPMQSAGCVFVDLKDPSDQCPLTLARNGSGIEATLPSKAPLPRFQPSVWHYNEDAGEWDETVQRLAVNGSELTTLTQPEDQPPPAEAEEEGLAKQQEEEEKDLQSQRQKLDAQRAAEGEEKICTCGYASKQALLPLIRKSFEELKLTDPPKRIFANTATGKTGEVEFAFPYISEDEQTASSQKAAKHPEVILSHHLVRATQILGRPWVQGSEHTSLFYASDEAREALPSLRVISDWLLDKAEAKDRKTDEKVEDVDPSLFPLKVLEKLAGLWVQSRGYSAVPGPTLEEMCIALEDSGGDVSEALLSVARDQARRSEVARVRSRLQQEDHRLTARYRQVDQALDVAKCNVEKAAESLLQDPAIKCQLEKLKVREKLFEHMPMAHPSSKQLEVAMEEAQGDLEKGAITVEQLVEKAAKLLQESPEVQEGAKEVYKTWKETLETAAADDTNTFNFEIQDTGWNNVDAVAISEESEPATAKQYTYVPLEFFPPPPRPLCPAGDSSMVLGAFDDGVFAVRATAADLGYRGIDYTEAVQPDGTFSLNVLGSARFEIKTSKADGTSSFDFGPFYAASRRQVTHLGLLSPPRDDGTSWEELLVDLDIVMPALEFPPHGKRSSNQFSEWVGTWEIDRSEMDPKVMEVIDANGLNYPITMEQRELCEGEDEDDIFPVLEISIGEYFGHSRPRGELAEVARGRYESTSEENRFNIDEVAQSIFVEFLEGEICPAGFFTMTVEQAPDTANFFWCEDSYGGGFSRSMKIKRIKKDSGERCTCFGDGDAEEEPCDEYDEM
eukprot:TRINITY_DN23728_c0_g1_i1.p1 TRINITY_DN23728_c0_g1~~TRINITY_DN23728_c0_g1_i1.p1  ORF type:complete len:1243 (+),score=295.55 TRINITY_DN23728_c0_g1_i1:33-3731(+)